jgi:nicotinamide mononucleotide transporter
MQYLLDSIITTWQAITPVEFWAVITSIAYAWLASRNNIWCWLFGIISPVLTMYALYFYFNLYAEVILQVYYIGMAIYGFYSWKYGGVKHSEKPIETWPAKRHLIVIFTGLILTFILGYFLKNYTAAASTYLDSFTTVFAILATYMTAKRILENWIYWIIIDTVSIFLYAGRGGYFFALLFIAYTLIAMYGLYHWRKQIKTAHV